MELLTQEGARYRTRLMERPAAESFAACLRANPRFAEISVQESSQAKQPRRRWMVVFEPSSPLRRKAALARHQERRTRKAKTEGRHYLFVTDPDSKQPFAWCLSRSGEVYEVTLFDCTCPDYVYRGGAVGCRCKHMEALSDAINEGRIREW